jgi:hypothetical protein
MASRETPPAGEPPRAGAWRGCAWWWVIAIIIIILIIWWAWWGWGTIGFAQRGGARPA